MQKRKGKLVIEVWPGHGINMGPPEGGAVNDPDPNPKETMETKAMIKRERDLSDYIYQGVLIHVIFPQKPDALIVKACNLGRGAPKGRNKKETEDNRLRNVATALADRLKMRIFAYPGPIAIDSWGIAWCESRGRKKKIIKAKMIEIKPALRKNK